MPLNDKTLTDLAIKMLADYDAHNPGTQFGDGLRLSVPDAWLLQTAVSKLREQRGEKIVGFKIGAVFEGNQKLIGLDHPAWGRLWNNEQHKDKATLFKKDFANPSMEAEFGIILNRDIETDKTSLDDILRSIKSVHPVIEIHNFVFRGESPNGAELLANNAIHAGVVRGLGKMDPKKTITTDLELIYDGEIVDSWYGTKWPDDYLSAIDWLVQEQAKLGNKLRKNHLILTGALGPPIPIKNRQLVEANSPQIGRVSARFV
ncbi:MAG: hypothetical protein CMM32_07715 [Rhodospirillaceae bacterium]|nr:hypothetical protein [Rhodospirillaceae bacterium]|tara:strand:+ start:1025 stop:1804 length:780 start_codon:yes stop_codon:yes gene_type:complete